jgi:hypothetical protein
MRVRRRERSRRLTNGSESAAKEARERRKERDGGGRLSSEITSHRTKSLFLSISDG